MAGIAGLVIVAALLWKIALEPSEVISKSPDCITRHRSGFKRSWFATTACITLLVGLGTACVLTGEQLGMYMAFLFWLPIGPLFRILGSAIDTFLLLYDPQRSSDLVYWEN